MTEDLPVFLPPPQGFVYVELAGDGEALGVHQFYDGATVLDVINLTTSPRPDSLNEVSVLSNPLRDGEKLHLVKKGQRIASLRRGWMSAGQRMALGIPLHPDRMSDSDWAALPGIGPALAERIATDRQKNGEFGSFEKLIRVKGIGTKSLSRWKEFFDDV